MLSSDDKRSLLQRLIKWVLGGSHENLLGVHDGVALEEGVDLSNVEDEFRRGCKEAFPEMSGRS